MTKKGYLQFLPILVGSFLFLMLQSDSITWPIFAFTFHSLVIFWRCLIDVYIKYAKGNPQIKIPKKILYFKNTTSFVPMAITVMLGFIAHLYFFMGKGDLFFDFVAYSNIGPVFMGIFFGRVSGMMIPHRMSMQKLKSLSLFKFTKEKELSYATQDFIVKIRR